MKKKTGARGVKRKKVRRKLHPVVREPKPLLDPARIVAIAEEEADNICAPGLPGSLLHNVKTIAHCIQRALEEIRV